MPFTSKSILKLSHTLLFIICATFCFSQDLIIKKDSSKIYCKITKEDTDVIYYEFNKTNPPSVFVISKDEVLKYYYASNPKEEKIKIETLKQKDSIYSEKDKLLHFNAFIGQARPCYAYGDKDPTHEESGLARIGKILEASITLKLSKHIGISAMYFYQQNHFDNNKISDFLIANHPGYSFATTSTKWKIKGFMGGLYLTFPIITVKNLFFECSALAGTPNYTRPEFSLTISNNNGSGLETWQAEGKTNSLTGFFNANLRYRLFKSIYLVGGLDYMHSRVKFSNIAASSIRKEIYYNTLYTYTSQGTFDVTNKINSFNLKMGLAVTVGKRHYKDE